MGVGERLSLVSVEALDAASFEYLDQRRRQEFRKGGETRFSSREVF